MGFSKNEMDRLAKTNVCPSCCHQIPEDRTYPVRQMGVGTRQLKRVNCGICGFEAIICPEHGASEEFLCQQCGSDARQDRQTWEDF